MEGQDWDPPSWDAWQWGGEPQPTGIRLVSSAYGRALSLHIKAQSSVMTKHYLTNFTGEPVGSF